MYVCMFVCMYLCMSGCIRRRLQISTRFLRRVVGGHHTVVIGLMATPGGTWGRLGGRFWGCGITQSTQRSGDIDKVHKNKVVGHYQFKKKNDVCFDVRGCVSQNGSKASPGWFCGKQSEPLRVLAFLGRASPSSPSSNLYL